MNKKYLFLFAAMAIAVVLAIVYFGVKKQESADVDKIVLGLTRQPGSDLAVLALQKGFFKEAGLNVEVKKYDTGKIALYEGLLKGEADIVMSTEFPIIHAIIEKQPIKIIASIATSGNLNRVVARADSGIRSAKDLVGKKIGTQENSSPHYFLALFLEENGVNEESTHISFLEPKELLGALTSGKIEAFSMREPYITRAKELLGEKAIVFEAPSLYIQAELLLGNNDFVDKNKEAIGKLLKALIKAEEFAQKEPIKAMAIVSTELQVPKESYSLMWKELDLRVRLDQSLILLLENEARWIISRNMAHTKTVPNLLHHIDYSILEKLKPEAVTVIK